MTIDNREIAASMVAMQALQLANFCRCAPGAPARILARWIRYDHALADAEHLLRRALEDTDPTTLDAFHLINALAAIAGAQELGDTE